MATPSNVQQTAYGLPTGGWSQDDSPSWLAGVGNALSSGYDKAAAVAGKVADTAKSINGAVADPDFWDSVGSNTAQFLKPIDTPTTAGLPSRDEMAKMDWQTLYNLRNQKGLSEQDQNYISPYEHQAYAREQSDSPYHALQQAVMTIGYTPYKALQIGGKSRSQPSLREVGKGLLGAWEGATR